MTKEEIFNKLEKLDLPKDKYIVISGASLVVQDIIEETTDIDLACSKNFFDKLDWPVREEYNSKIKYKDIFDIDYDLYDEKRVIEVNGYRFMNIEACYEPLKVMNKPKDKKLIKELELKVCLKDNYYFERKLRETGINFIAGVDEVDVAL